MDDKPKDLRKVGNCKRCGLTIYHSDSQPTHPCSNVGDYDFVCYACQFKLMDENKWTAFRDKYLNR